MPSKSPAFFEWAILLLLLLLPAASKAQDDTQPWFWIMADSVGGKVVCPGLCLAVNDSSSTGNYTHNPVGFVACKTSDSSSDSGSMSSDTNSNQQWLRYDDNKENITIRINATGSTGSTESTESTLLCLQPDPITKRSLTVTKCNGQSNQKWIVANNTVASLAFDPPRSLAMSYRVSDFLTLTNGVMAWREASVVAGKAQNSTLTTTFSMVEGDDTQNLDLNPPEDKAPPVSRNFITNGGFEQSSYGFPNAPTNLSLNAEDIFGLCYWKIIKTGANLQNGPSSGSAPSEGNRSLYLNDGIVSQKVTTSPGAFYSIVFKVAVATSSPSDASATSGDQTCQGSDTLSVNPYPSTNVDMTVEVSNKSWVTNHVSFQALGKQVQLAFKGCSACGCYLDEVNLMQVIDHAPFPPPPRPPSPPPCPPLPFPNETIPPGEPHNGVFPKSQSNRLSNAAVVGVVVGAAALFFVIGAACFAVVCLSKSEKGEIDTRRPAEWSIHTTTPARSERTKGSVSGSIHHTSSNVPGSIHHSNSNAPGSIHHSSSNAPTSAIGATISSSNPNSGSAP